MFLNDERWLWSKFNNLPGKRFKTKILKVFGTNSYVCRNCRVKTGRASHPKPGLRCSDKIDVPQNRLQIGTKQIQYKNVTFYKFMHRIATIFFFMIRTWALEKSL